MISKYGRLSLGETTYSALIFIVKASLAKNQKKTKNKQNKTKQKCVKIMIQILPPKGKLQKLKYQDKRKILCNQILKQAPSNDSYKCGKQVHRQNLTRQKR